MTSSSNYNSSTVMMKRVLQRLPLAVVLLLNLPMDALAFYAKPTLCPNNARDVSVGDGQRRRRISPPSTTTSLFAAVKFKNVEEMISSVQDEPLLVFFTAINCGPCRLQKKELAGLKQLYGSDNHALKVVAIETEKWPAVGSRFHVGKLPCLVVLQHQKEVLRLEGLTKADVLMEQVRAYL